MEEKKRFSIAKKLIVIYMILAIPMVAIIAYSHFNGYQIRIERTLVQRTEIARMVASSFTSLIDRLGETMHLVGGSIVDNRYSDERASLALKELLDDYPINNAVYADATGTVKAATDSRLINKNLANRAAFKKIVKSHLNSGIEPVDHSVNDFGFYVTRAIKTNDGAVVGVVGCYVDLGKLNKMMRIRIPSGGINIVDSRGNLVYQNEYSELAQEGYYWGKYDFVKEALAGRSKTSRDFIFPGNNLPRLVSEVPIEAFSWAAGSGVTAEDVTGPLKKELLQASLLTAIVLLIALGASVTIARRIVRSLAMLVESSRSVGEGRFDEPIILDTGDEIEEVARSLNEARLNLKRAEEALEHERERLAVTLSSIGDGVIATDTSEKIVLINQVAEKLTGWTQEEAVGRYLTEVFNIVNEITGEQAENPVSVSLQTGEIIALANHTALIAKDGTNISIADSCAPVRDMTGAIIGAVLVFRDATKERTVRDLREALNSINLAIGSSLNPNEIMKRVVVDAAKALNAEKALASLCKNGVWRITAVHGLPSELEGQKIIDEQDETLLRVKGIRQPIVSKDVVSDAAVQGDITHILTVPLIVKDTIIGVMEFSGIPVTAGISDSYLEFSEKLATLVSLAVESARLYEVERNISHTLQGAMLSAPARIEGIIFGHLYRSASEAAQVGGDFYDIFEIETGKIGIILGDVSGKGIKASTATARVKNTIKAYAYDNDTPETIMAKTNNVIFRSSSLSSFITVFFGLLDIGTGRLTYCSAGHPPAIIKRASSEVSLLAANSPLIGAFANFDYEADEIILEPGDTLVLYTDGVIEARSNMEAVSGELLGEERLLDTIGSLRSAGAEDIPQFIYDSVIAFTGEKLADDVAILAVSLESAAWITDIDS